MGGTSGEGINTVKYQVGLLLYSAEFFADFAASKVKMGGVQVLTCVQERSRNTAHFCELEDACIATVICAFAW